MYYFLPPTERKGNEATKVVGGCRLRRASAAPLPRPACSALRSPQFDGQFEVLYSP